MGDPLHVQMRQNLDFSEDDQSIEDPEYEEANARNELQNKFV